MRRKKKTVRKNNAADDTKLKSALKRMNMQQLPGIEQVNMFREDNTVLHFQQPQVQAGYKTNFYVVSGTPETK
jgi:nascent polypeptide-associated complex subunit beta